MTPQRISQHLVLACSFLACATFAADVADAQTQTAFEASPVLEGSVLAPVTLLKGPLHTVAEPIKLQGFFGQFVIESKFGKFAVVGVNMLGVRVNELQAIAALQEVQSSKAFQDSLVQAASAPVQLVQSAVNNPLGTVENIGQGLGSVLGRVGFLAQAGAQSVVDAASDRNAAPAAPSTLPRAPAGEQMPSLFTGDPFGYNKARRDWARRLNIDPYTSNPVLRPLLDKAAAASFAGSFAVDTAIASVSMGANLVVGFDTDVRDAVWNQPAVDLARQNESRLLAMGVDPRVTRDFLRNRWFTPSLQTALVVALSKLGNVAGVDAVIRIAVQVQGEANARFVIESVRMLVQYSEKQAHLAGIRMNNMVPVGVKDDGTLVIAAAVDYVFWDKAASEFTKRRQLRGKGNVVLVAGGASERATQEFRKAGFTLLSGLRP